MTYSLVGRLREGGISAVSNERRHGMPSLRMGLWAINQMRGSPESLGAPGGKVAVSDSTSCFLNPVWPPLPVDRGLFLCDGLQLSINNLPLSPLTRPHPCGAPSSWDRRAGRRPLGIRRPSAAPFLSHPCRKATSPASRTDFCSALSWRALSLFVEDDEPAHSLPALMCL